MLQLRKRSEGVVALSAILACLLVASTLQGEGVAERDDPPTLLAFLDVPTAVQDREKVVVRVTIRQQGKCAPQYIDSYFVSSRAVGRPGTVIQFSVIEAFSGEPLMPGKPPLLHLKGLSTDELVLLDCGRFFGDEIFLSDPEWKYVFRPGKYRVRASIRIDLQSYFADFPTVAKGLMAATGLSEAGLRNRTTPVTLQSNEIEFEVQ
jgi:hypothetical protein